MEKEPTTGEYKIDASGKVLGRVASLAAKVLMGKNDPEYSAHILAKTTVHILNTSKAKISSKKQSEKIYTRYSGYPGGLKKESMEHAITQKGYSELFRRAVYGMLPSNKLRAGRMKNLIISE